MNPTETETQPATVPTAILDVRAMPLEQVPVAGLIDRIRPERRTVGSDRVPVAAFNASL